MIFLILEGLMVQQWVKDLVSDTMGDAPVVAIGKQYTLVDGRKIQITAGRLWGEHGISNFWSWKDVLPDGTLVEKGGCGYPHVLRPGETAETMARCPHIVCMAEITDSIPA
jgi:hypothetical protein